MITSFDGSLYCTYHKIPSFTESEATLYMLKVIISTLATIEITFLRLQNMIWKSKINEQNRISFNSPLYLIIVIPLVSICDIKKTTI